MTKLEKTIIGIMVACILIVIVSTYSCVRAVDEAGGWGQIYIDINRELENPDTDVGA